MYVDSEPDTGIGWRKCEHVKRCFTSPGRAGQPGPSRARCEMRAAVKIVTLLAVLVGIPAVARAQAVIAGTVKDPSGAVLPGVSVEAASPALIEKVRTAVTDGNGQYRIEDLRPGSYTVTFVLQGFSTLRREGIELTGSFTASINADLKVGALAETVTVT